MKEYPAYLSATQGNPNPRDGEPYFPPLYSLVDCLYCEDRKTCPNFGKDQRNRRDFSYVSGRCPRLPDRRGFVDKQYKELYAQTFPLIHAERGSDEDSLYLSLSIPGKKRLKKVYCKEYRREENRKYNCWWFRDKEGEFSVKRLLMIGNNLDRQGILESMENRNADYCIFPCEILSGFL